MYADTLHYLDIAIIIMLVASLHSQVKNLEHLDAGVKAVVVAQLTNV